MPYLGLTASKSVALAAFLATSATLPQTQIVMALPASASKSIVCQIRVEPVPSGLRLDALAEPQATVTGEYRLSVAKESASGSSRNVQSGAFQAEAGQQRILATIILDRSAIGHYNATLSLNWEDGHESCSSP